MGDDWVAKVCDDKLNKLANDSIAADKYAIATAEAPAMESLLREKMQQAVAKFAHRVGGVEGPIETPEGFTKFRTAMMPLEVVEFRFEKATILIKTYSLQSHSASPKVFSDTILIHGEFDKEPWFERKGKRLSTVDELSESLLVPLFKAVKLPN